MRIDDPNDVLAQFLEEARHTVDEVDGSLSCIFAVGGLPHPMLCMKIGAALLLNKPILFLVPKGLHLPEKLLMVADEVVEMSMPMPPEGTKQLEEAIGRIKQLALNRAECGR